MIIKKQNINPQYGQSFSVTGSSELRFLKVGLDETGLVLYYLDHNYGGNVYYSCYVTDMHSEMVFSSNMKCIGIESGYVIFADERKSDETDRIINEIETKASCGELPPQFIQALFQGYEEVFISNVLARLESKDLADLQQRLIAQVQDLERQLRQKQEVITHIEAIAKEIGYQADFVRNCPAM